MTRASASRRCIPISLVVLFAVCALLVGAAGAQAASGPSPGAASGSNGVSASIRAIQPAVSGLFQVHAPRVWADALDASGNPGQNGIPDFLDTWEAFRARKSSAILRNGYAFTTIEEPGRETLYAGVERASTGGPSSVVLEFNQKPGERTIGDLRIGAEIDAAGEVGTVRFESYFGEAKGGAKFLSLAILSGEGCSDAGTACVVANGTLLEFGYNLTALGKPEKDFAGIQIRTPEDHAIGTFQILSVITGGCVKEQSSLSTVNCTANDVRLASIKEGSLIVTEGCNGGTCTGGTKNGQNCNFTGDCPGGTCSDTVTFTAVAEFVAGPQRYDVGVFIATDGGGTDGAKTGSCQRLTFPNTGNYCLGGTKEGGSCVTSSDCTGGGTCLSYANLDQDSCGDINAGQTLAFTIGPVTIACSDTNGDGQADIFNCETWAQRGDEIPNCTTDTVKAGSPSKCGCALLTGPGSCIAVPDSNPCDNEVCQGTCSNSSTTTCTDDRQCLINSVQGQCTGIQLRHVPGNAGATCRASTGVCDPAEVCDGVSATCPADVFSSSATQCRAAASGGCDAAEFCTGSSGACPADAVQVAGFECRPSAGACDPAEFCTGSSPTCPADVLASSSTVCRTSTGVCDPAENCTGSSPTCPADVLASSSTVCRASTGVCDPAENCTGSSGACPADVLASSSTVCRASAGVCDPAENCTGSSGACPADVLASSSTVCRAAEGDCDVAENCTGTSASCPADAVRPSTFQCRASDGSPCDPAEFCDGIGKNCGPDVCASGLRDPNVPKDICTPRT
jgi:hypothetical protein